MKISLNWLKEYLPELQFDSIQTLADKMVSAGLDIEGIEDESRLYDKFVVGEVIEKEKHPNADKLSLCKVDIGDSTLSIVCGAPNVAKGQKVCVAKIGAIIPNGDFEIKKSKIRGELSEGMICSEKELNISESHEGILVLQEDAKTGTPFSDYLKANDVVFEIGITPNRGDLFSHIGAAREVGALYDKKITVPEISLKESDTLTSNLINIKIENPELCRRFTGRVIQNVQIKESPEWLKKRITSVGLKPKNNMVDITNFVMFETGQPLHAFDYDKINGKEIIVRTAAEGDRFVTLDSKERILNSESLMICDSKGYIGIAGVMGGKDSEISGETKNIFLEVAYFDPVSIRKNSKKLALQTDASQRFERGVDMNMVDYASNRAAQLIQEIAGGTVSKELYEIYPEKFGKIEIGLRLGKVNDITGLELSEDEVIGLLDKIEIKFLRKDSEEMIFTVPEFRRMDIEREIDLAEEVARIYGYGNIEEDTRFRINIQNTVDCEGPGFKFTKEISDYLNGRGFSQIQTNSLVEEKKIRSFTDKIVKLKNSVSTEMDSMRTSLIFGMLKTISNNFNNSGKDISLKLFETGRTFTDEGDRFNEEVRLILAMAGRNGAQLIYGGESSFDLFDIKGEAEMFLSKLNLENFALFYYNDKSLDGIKIDIRLKDELIGNIYKIDSSLRKQFEIDSDVYAAEFYLSRLSVGSKTGKKFTEYSKFPSVKRDIALVVDSKVTYEELKSSILRSGGTLIKDLRIFDIYEDSKIGKGSRSLAFSIEFSSNEKTLTDEETNKILKKILENLESKHGATLRD